MEKGAEQIPALVALKKSDAKAFERAWKSLREDGAYVEAGENDNVIVQKLEANKNAFGVFGFSFLDENSRQVARRRPRRRRADLREHRRRQVQGLAPLFVYIKKQHVGLVPGIDKFAAEYVSNKAIGEDGYLAKKGLVTLPKGELEVVRKDVTGMVPMQTPELADASIDARRPRPCVRPPLPRDALSSRLNSI